MANANITLVTVTNTFDEWRVASNDLITDRNILRNAPYVKDNSDFQIANGAVTIARSTGGTLLTVAGGGSALVGGTTTTTDLVVTDDASVANQLSVTGNTVLSGNLSVAKNTALAQNANVVGTVNLSNTLEVTGNANLYSNVTISKNAVITLNAAVLGTAAITGNTTLSSNLSVAANAVLSQNANVAGTMNVGSILNVAGNTALASNLAVSGNTTVSQNANVTGTFNVGSLLSVTGNTSLLSNLTVGWNIAAGNLSITQNTTTGNIVVAQNAAVGNITITQNTSTGNLSTVNLVVSGLMNAATGNIVTAYIDSLTVTQPIAAPAVTTDSGYIVRNGLTTDGDGFFRVKRSAASGNAELYWDDTTTDSWRVLVNGQLGPIAANNLTISRNVSTGNIAVTQNLSVGNIAITGNVSGINTSGNVTATLKAYRDFLTTGTASGATSVDLSQSNWYRYTLSTGSTFTFVNAPVAGTAFTVTLLLTQGSGGGKTVNWGNTIYWAGGQVPPATTTTTGNTDLWTFTTVDGGSTYYGTLAIKDAR